MDIGTYLSFMSQGAFAVVMTAGMFAAMMVIVLYVYKTAVWLIMGSDANIKKLKSVVEFRKDTPAVRMVKMANEEKRQMQVKK